VPSTKKPTELTTSLLPTKQEFKMRSVGESSGDDSESSGIIIIAVVVIVIIVVVVGIGAYFFVKKSKKRDTDSTYAKKHKGVGKTLSKESMFSIATVNSVTGAPVHSNADAKTGKKAAKKL
jgi:flagellar basal body-associated protein FliL